VKKQNNARKGVGDKPKHTFYLELPPLDPLLHKEGRIPLPLQRGVPKARGSLIEELR